MLDWSTDVSWGMMDVQNHRTLLDRKLGFAGMLHSSRQQIGVCLDSSPHLKWLSKWSSILPKVHFIAARHLQICNCTELEILKKQEVRWIACWRHCTNISCFRCVSLDLNPTQDPKYLCFFRSWQGITGLCIKIFHVYLLYLSGKNIHLK